MSSFASWAISLGIPAACMGVAYVVTSGRDYWARKNASPSSVVAANKDGGKKKRQRKRRAPAPKASSDASVPAAFVVSAGEEAEEEEGEEEASTEDETENMAVMLERLSNRSSTSSLAIPKLAASTDLVKVTPHGVEDEQEEGWNRIDRHQENVQQLKTRIATLQEQVDALTMGNSEQARQLDASQKRIAALEAEGKERTRLFAAQLKQAEGDLDKARRDVADTQASLAKVGALGEEVTELTDKLSTMQALITAGEEEASANRLLVEQLQAQLAAKDAAIADLAVRNEEQLRELKQSALANESDACDRERSLNGEISGLKGEAERLHAKLAALEAEAQANQHERSVLKSAAGSLERQLDERAKLVQQLQGENAGLAGRLASLKAEASKPATDANPTLLQYMEVLINAQRSFHAEKAALVAQIVDLRRRLSK